MKRLLFVLSIALFAIESTPVAATEELGVAATPEHRGVTEGVGGVLTRQIQDDLHFSLVPVYRINSSSWASFSREVEGFFNGREVERGSDVPIALRKASGGASQVRIVFNRKVTDDEGNNVWMGVFSYTPLSLDKFLRLKAVDQTNIEMAVTVSTKADAPFAVHMGIFRNTLAYYERFSRDAGDYHKRKDSPKMHKGIAMLLHRTMAQAVSFHREIHKQPALQYMITSPLKTMRQIILKAMPEGAVAVGSHSDEVIDEEWYNDYKERQLAEIKDEGVCLDTTPIYEVYDEETKTHRVRFELRNEAGEVTWASNVDDASYWLVRNASNVDPYIAVPYAALADTADLNVKE